MFALRGECRPPEGDVTVLKQGRLKQTPAHVNHHGPARGRRARLAGGRCGERIRRRARQPERLGQYGDDCRARARRACGRAHPRDRWLGGDSARRVVVGTGLACYTDTPAAPVVGDERAPAVLRGVDDAERSTGPRAVGSNGVDSGVRHACPESAVELTGPIAGGHARTTPIPNSALCGAAAVATHTRVGPLAEQQNVVEARQSSRARLVQPVDAAHLLRARTGGERASAHLRCNRGLHAVGARDGWVAGSRDEVTGEVLLDHEPWHPQRDRVHIARQHLQPRTIEEQRHGAHPQGHPRPSRVGASGRIGRAPAGRCERACVRTHPPAAHQKGVQRRIQRHHKPPGAIPAVPIARAVVGAAAPWLHVVLSATPLAPAANPSLFSATCSSAAGAAQIQPRAGSRPVQSQLTGVRSAKPKHDP
eukprot:scaffold332_cov105-Isochrysis_galbana.AAC.10